MSYRFDHAVVLVADLDRAVRDYDALGFTVTPGGRHAGGATHNALIAFEDGSYLELLAYTSHWRWRTLPWLRRLGFLGRAAEGRSGLERRFLERSGRGEGLIDYALRPDDLDAQLSRVSASGIQAEGPIPGGRVRPDGEEVAWQVAIPRAEELPFLCADLSPHEQRVPTGAAREHANGATGIAGVVVAVRNLEATSARFRALLGVEPSFQTEVLPAGARGRTFPIDGAGITLAAPAGGRRELQRYLRERGEGPFSLRVRCAGDFSSRPLDPARTHGARLELESR